MNKQYLDPTLNCSTLVDLLHWRALYQANQPAFTFLLDGDTQQLCLTYGELDRRARAIAAQLQSRQAAGQRALLLYPPSLDYIVGFLACLYAGVVAVPVYPPDPARLNRTLPRLQAIVADAQISHVLTTSPILAMAQQLYEKLHWLTTDHVDEALAEKYKAPEISGSSLAFLQYTSGSTATPRGVMVSHSNILYNEHMIQVAFENVEQTTVVGWLPLYHDMGLLGNVIQPLYLGAHCILMSPMHFLQRPWRWLQAISRYKAHTSGGPNFAYDLCVRKIKPEQRATLDLSSWTVAFNGAEPVRSQTLERFAEAFEPYGFRREALYPCYGLAEATLFVSGGPRLAPPVLFTVRGADLAQGCVTAASAGEKNSQTLVGCGQTWLDQRIVYVDPETCIPTPPNRVGEIWVAGPNVAQGYWNNPEESARTFKAYLADTGEGPFLRTGDLGFLRGGQLFITGRAKDVIIVDGRNIYPQDIELTVEASHPAIRPGCSAAFSIDVKNQEQVVIVAEVDLRRAQELAGKPALESDIAKSVRQAVTEQHDLHPYEIVLLEPQNIPKTSSGKIQRYACRAAYLAGSWE